MTKGDYIVCIDDNVGHLHDCYASSLVLIKSKVPHHLSWAFYRKFQTVHFWPLKVKSCYVFLEIKIINGENIVGFSLINCIMSIINTTLHVLGYNKNIALVKESCQVVQGKPFCLWNTNDSEPLEEAGLEGSDTAFLMTTAAAESHHIKKKKPKTLQQFHVRADGVPSTTLSAIQPSHQWHHLHHLQ